MSFYSLMVRDQKRGWLNVGSDVSLQAVQQQRQIVNELTDNDVRILKTGSAADMRSFEHGVAYMNSKPTSALSKVFSFFYSDIEDDRAVPKVGYAPAYCRTT